jgi:dGTPase
VDDGLTAGLFSEKQLSRDVRLWREAAQAVKKDYGNLPDECRRYFIIRCLIDSQVKDVVWTTEARITAARVRSNADAPLHATPLVRYSPNRRKLNLELRDYLYHNLYYNPEVHEPNRRAVRLLEELFKYYLAHRPELGDQVRKRARRDGWARAICDYLAGMTDRYAIQEHQRVFGPPV